MLLLGTSGPSECLYVTIRDFWPEKVSVPVSLLGTSGPSECLYVTIRDFWPE